MVKEVNAVGTTDEENPRTGALSTVPVKERHLYQCSADLFIVYVYFKFFLNLDTSFRCRIDLIVVVSNLFKEKKNIYIYINENVRVKSPTPM